MTHTVFIRTVYPIKHRTGERFDVVLVGNGLPVEVDGIPFTWNALHASLCQRASVLHRAVTMTTKQTTWGAEIVGVALVPEYAELAS